MFGDVSVPVTILRRNHLILPNTSDLCLFASLSDWLSFWLAKKLHIHVTYPHPCTTIAHLGPSSQIGINLDIAARKLNLRSKAASRTR
jgi:hypothetical protein